MEFFVGWILGGYLDGRLEAFRFVYTHTYIHVHARNNLCVLLDSVSFLSLFRGVFCQNMWFSKNPLTDI